MNIGVSSNYRIDNQAVVISSKDKKLEVVLVLALQLSQGVNEVVDWTNLIDRRFLALRLGDSLGLVLQEGPAQQILSHLQPC